MSINQAINYQRAMQKAMGAKAKKLHPELMKETYFLFIANAFIKMYIDGTSKKYNRVEKLCEQLAKKSRVFGKNLYPIIETALELFEDVEKQQLKLRNKPIKSKFEKRVTFDKDDTLSVHGLLFALSMILEHETIPNRKLHLPYAEARSMIKDFDECKGAMYRNARLLPAKFKDLLYATKA